MVGLPSEAENKKERPGRGEDVGLEVADKYSFWEKGYNIIYTK